MKQNELVTFIGKLPAGIQSRIDRSWGGYLTNEPTRPDKYMRERERERESEFTSPTFTQQRQQMNKTLLKIYV